MPSRVGCFEAKLHSCSGMDGNLGPRREDNHEAHCWSSDATLCEGGSYKAAVPCNVPPRRPQDQPCNLQMEVLRLWASGLPCLVKKALQQKMYVCIYICHIYIYNMYVYRNIHAYVCMYMYVHIYVNVYT